MILVDTSVWIQHLRTGEPTLVELLDGSQVLSHPYVLGELALGRLSQREEILGLLSGLPRSAVATHDEVLAFVETHDLPGTGIGYVDAHLLAATLLTPGGRLWTADSRLAAAAVRRRTGRRSTGRPPAEVPSDGPADPILWG